MASSSPDLPSVVVLKFGSSVLRSPDHLPEAVHEIYRYVREARKVIAVVSAFEGETSQLLRDSERFGPHPDPYALASWMSVGERRASALLALALEQHGIPTRLAEPSDLRIIASGPPLDAQPEMLSVDYARNMLDSASVTVLPGFFASDAAGRCVLLGRGGSDHTALFVAQLLGADCVLLKDVYGIYDHDPAEAGPATHQYEHICWADAERLAGKLVQPKALRFAHERRFPFKVAGVGQQGGTTVSAETAPPSSIRPRPPPLRIILLGLGTVGLGVYRELLRRPDLFEVKCVAVRDKARHVAAGIDPAILTTDPVAAVAIDCDVVVELMGGGEPAGQSVEISLAAGKSVVTANKTLIATRGEDLEKLASGNQTMLRYSAAVGGGVPMIELTRHVASRHKESDPIVSIRGIVNGTCNFVLEQLERGVDFADAVALAQASGFAEAEPSDDLSGLDSAAKLTVLARIIGCKSAPANGQISGIDEQTLYRVRAAQLEGHRPKLLATLNHSLAGCDLRVALEDLPPGDWLAHCTGVQNALEIRCASGSRFQIRGKGAGRAPTTVAVMADIYEIWRERASGCDLMRSRDA